VLCYQKSLIHIFTLLCMGANGGKRLFNRSNIALGNLGAHR
jgi:hypothetical protein